MTNDPGDQPNPFKGTPFEQIFAAFGGSAGTPGGGGMPDFAALMSQVQAMMQPHEGAVNWKLATDTARRTVAQDADPSPGSADSRKVEDALRLADHWLDEVTALPSGVTASAVWSRAEWIEQTVPQWRTLVEPVAEHVVKALGEAMPAEAKAMAGPLMSLLGQAGGAMFGAQVGQALAGLASEVLSASDVGLPLAPTGRAAMLPANIDAFAEGLEVPDEDVLLYLALREAAHQRLFGHVPWLGPHLVAAVEDYGRGTTIDIAGMEAKLSGVDPMNPASLQEALEGGLFEPQQTPTQQAALIRLETILALVEGWVDEVVTQATAGRMPNASRLQEIVRRRRAAGGPAERAFAALVGLELRPRRLRDAAALWGNLRSRRGSDARDAVWSHPDLLPTAADLDDPLGFGERPEIAVDEGDLDAALAQLLSGDGDEPGSSGGDVAGDGAAAATPDTADEPGSDEGDDGEGGTARA